MAGTTPMVSSLRAWYGASIAEFLASDQDLVLGQLTSHSDFAVLPTQRDAWRVQIDILRSHLPGLDGSVFLEFNIPRMGRRVDGILLIGPVVFAIEFKVGERVFDRAAIDQVWDYALDLRNFHEASHEVSLVPILVATECPQPPRLRLTKDPDRVFRPILTHPSDLRTVLEEGVRAASGAAIDGPAWAGAPYRPTPTIVEAARALYSRHSVEAIARFDAGARNLQVTSHRIEELIDEARAASQKVICFVTGVPGAGKTLVGLNVATRRRDAEQPTHAVFLSGNGPLVAVLREALTRDECERRKEQGERVRKGRVGECVKAFIQNVHHFRDDGLINSGPPVEHVVIFDEAQRAWNRRQTASFMRRKKNRPGFDQSEPEFLISYLDRHADWAVIICLVGGGQEINTGEAGIGAWLEAVNHRFEHWRRVISPRLIDSEYAADGALETARRSQATRFEDSLHLAVSMRSFRAENVSAFIKALLDGERQKAREAFSEFRLRYPLALTRSLPAAKSWIRSHARGSERYGLVASSKSMRLKPHAIDIRVAINPVHYFLNDREDTRSSYYLEDVATEFQVQGLELDWVCVAWDADFRAAENGWTYHDFRGDRWCNIANPDNREYLRNAYRVLLTRARQGMVVFIPPGDPHDPTRSPAFYDSSYQLLREIGIPEIT
ncbi:MAG: DUF2075 domain-containing protein [Verrucomicrobiae bacterium]|nr:DUF2075 domain-containing protein [Verrucomicrobiae bacterium]